MTGLVKSADWLAIVILAIVFVVVVMALISISRRKTCVRLRLGFIILLVISVIYWFQDEIGNLILREVDISKPLIKQVIATCWWAAMAMVASSLVDKYIWEGLYVRGGAPAAPRILTDIIAFFFYVAVALLVLKFVWEISITVFAAASGVAAVIVAYSARGVFSDLFSGIALNINPGFVIGDYLEVEGKAGILKEISWRYVVLETLDRNELIIPNSHIATVAVVNRSVRQHEYRISFDVRIDYAVTVGEVLQIVKAAVAELIYAKESEVVLSGYDIYGMIYDVRCWVGKQYFPNEVIDQLRAAIYYKIAKTPGASFGFNKQQAQIRYYRKQRESTQELIDMLREVQFLQVLNDQELHLLTTEITRICFGPPETIIRQGEGGTSMFIIFQGEVEVYVEEAGAKISVARLHENDYFGDMSLLTGAPRAATVKANDDVIVYELQKQSLARIIQVRPIVIEKIADVVAERQLASKEIAAQLVQSKRKRSFADRLKKNILNFFAC